MGNFVWTYLDHEESITLASEEDDTEERDSDTDENNSGSSKRGVNLLEEELHLAEHATFSGFDFDLKLKRMNSFSVITDKINGSKKAPLDNPPEIEFELS